MRKALLLVLVLCTAVFIAVGAVLIARSTSPATPIWAFNPETKTYMFRGDRSLNNPEVTEFTIPSERNGFPVTEIGARAFRNFTHLERVTLPTALIEIHDRAFENSGLVEIDIPHGVQRIGHSAFLNANNLASVTLPNNANFRIIHAHTFQNTAIETIILPHAVHHLGSHAFANTNLEEVIIQHAGGVITITANTFANTDILRFFIPNPPTNPEYDIGLIAQYYYHPLWIPLIVVNYMSRLFHIAHWQP